MTFADNLGDCYLDLELSYWHVHKFSMMLLYI